nr:6K1 [Dendrobium chlorotic mosaic virus]
AKSPYEQGLEKTVGIFALVAMIFDTARSDAVFRILSKLKTVFSLIDDKVHHQ